jgi:hypothetical protein
MFFRQFQGKQSFNMKFPHQMEPFDIKIDRFSGLNQNQ